MNNLLSRHAECIFWLARQVERANSTARILDVNETFSRNARGEHDWESVLRLYGDELNFRATGRKPTADAVIHFYILDDQNPNSVLSNIRMARENARALRPLISTEMWVQLNGFHNRLSRLRTPRPAGREPQPSVQLHQGVLPDPQRHHRRDALP